MKLSLAWIFDHIKNCRWSDLNIPELLASLRGMPAEIDAVHEINIAWDTITLGKVIENSSRQVVVESAEWGKKITLPVRSDVSYGGYFLVSKDGKEYRWTLLSDVGGVKDGFVPEVACAETEVAGAWKQQCESRDYILEIDNKSITNRPDLWGHRGFAREVALFLKLTMVPEEHITSSFPIQHYKQKTDTSAPYTIALETPVCDRFAGIELQATCAPSMPWMVSRLARVEVRARNLFVDLTNYVMFDIGQPMHVFDAEKIRNKTLIARQAHAGEKIDLLDDTSIELTPQDCVIADDRFALSLAGIIGGVASSVHKGTKKIFLEAAHFEGGAIRQSATRHKKRTESSLRFEKTLDPHANTLSILRYLTLLRDSGVMYTNADAIISVGSLLPERTITVEHRFIIDRLGMPVLPDQVEQILRALGFGVQVAENIRGGGVYTLTLPTWRTEKDISIKEDIVEEIGRCCGYTTIHPVVPVRAMVPHDYSAVYTCRSVKQHCAFALHMREVYNYALYDAQFLQKVGIHISHAAALKNPVSEHWQVLVTSLVPHLLKNIAQNCANESRLRFFEWARTWQQDGEKMHENTTCAGIVYEQSGAFDFYEGKALVQSLFKLLGYLVEWRKPTHVAAWMNEFQTAELVCQGHVIGYAGMVQQPLLEKIAQGKAFAFEINMTALMALQPLALHFEEPSKYQPVDLDVSMLVPYTVSMAELEDALAHADARVKDIVLVDVFEKNEWRDQRSITLRCRIQDDDKTLTKEDIEELQKTLAGAVARLGAQVR